ncbi:MAG: hypothetical protein HWE11_04475 [Gammaproteobacteria bacterium]|nr:hypothetical protein [Gammaproteobacteria bacterium]
MNCLPKVVVILVSLQLLGCATQYQPMNIWSVGYSETQLGENIYKVSFQGNDPSEKVRIEDFTLLRCAELALEKGASWFIIIGSGYSENVSSYTAPVTTTTITSPSGYPVTTTSGGQTYISATPTSSNTIVLLKDKPAGFSYEAAFVVKSIKEKYKIK